MIDLSAVTLNDKLKRNLNMEIKKELTLAWSLVYTITIAFALFALHEKSITLNAWIDQRVFGLNVTYCDVQPSVTEYRNCMKGRYQ